MVEIALQIKKSKFQYTVIDYNDVSDNIDYTHLKNIDHSKRMEERIYTSLSAAKRSIIDIGLNNEFNYFITITYDDSKQCNSFNWGETKNKTLKAFNNFKNRYDSNFKYLIVPEAHKSGRLHFHGWIYTEREDFITYMYYDEEKHHRVYRQDWLYERLGSIHLVKIKEYKLEVALYVTEYISKMINDVKEKTGNGEVYPFKQYYFASQKLKRSEVIFQTNDGVDIEMLLGQFDLIPNHEFQDFYCKIYRLDNDDLIRFIIDKNNLIDEAIKLIGQNKIKNKR